MPTGCEATLETAVPTAPGAPAFADSRGPAEACATVIERKSGWRFIDFRELWKNRELLWFLTWRDLKLRYKQTALGAAWALIQPLGTMLVFALFLGRVAADPSQGNYPLFVLAGFLPWTFFANGISTASQSVVGNQSLVTKVYFPRLFIPMAAVGAGLVDFLIGFGILAAMMAWYGAAPGWNVLLLPVVVGLLVVAAVGIGAFLAALTVRYRDVRHAIPFLVQLWMLATPSIYLQAGGLIGEKGQTFLPLNPAYGLIANFRAVLLGGPIDAYALLVSGAVSVALLVVGCAYFRTVERKFADVI